MQKYLSENLVDIFFILGIGSLVILVISALSIGYFIKKIPHDYFLNDKRDTSQYKNKNFFLWVIAITFKNLIGYCLILGGILMLVLGSSLASKNASQLLLPLLSGSFEPK